MAATEIVFNGRRVGARAGQALLDAALAGNVAIPHDCATGQCNTCRVRVYDGNVDDRGTRVGDTVLACRAAVAGPAVIEFDEVPETVTARGTVSSIRDLTPNIVEVTIALEARLAYLPGQYVKVAFRGCPSRDYSPTLRMDGSGGLDELVLQIRREPDGLVSSRIGGAIAAGSAVKVTGPFGQAYHRLGQDRLVLVSSGVGWAPVWAIARASRLREPLRDLIVVAGARDAHDLYMTEAVEWLRASGASVTLASSGSSPPAGVVGGRTTEHLPLIRRTDTVVAAGAPAMVSAVALAAAAAGATCHADPFLPARGSHKGQSGVLGGLLRWIRNMSARDRRASTHLVKSR